MVPQDFDGRESAQIKIQPDRFWRLLQSVVVMLRGCGKVAAVLSSYQCFLRSRNVAYGDDSKIKQPPNPEDLKNIVIFSGTTSFGLTKQICGILNVEQGKIDTKVLMLKIILNMRLNPNPIDFLVFFRW